MIKRLQLFLCSLLLVFLAPQLSSGQTNTISVGPALTVSDNSAEEKGRKGLGGSFEFSHRLFSNSGLRFYTGVEKFHTPGRSNDVVTYIPFRGGYQHWLAKGRMFLWADAGIALLRYSAAYRYNLFTFSAGGGYLHPLGKNRHIQVEAFYVYTENKDPFYEDDHYGWVTFRAAYGIRFGGNTRIAPNPGF